MNSTHYTLERFETETDIKTYVRDFVDVEGFLECCKVRRWYLQGGCMQHSLIFVQSFRIMNTGERSAAAGSIPCLFEVLQL